MRKDSCWLTTLLVVIVYMSVVLFLWIPYYYINDDYIIRDILSGRYSGTADAHIYNVIYPFALFIKCLYQILPHADVWGLAMWGLMYVCLFFMIHRVFEIVQRYRFLAIVFIGIVFTCTFLFGAVFFTFTLTGAMCALTGLFLFMTDPRPIRISHYFPSIFLVLLSFCIRKDTFFMLLPFYVWWAVYKGFDSKKKKDIQHLCLFACSIVGICGILWVMHTFAYVDAEWQDFLEFRTLRKAVHDYDGYPAYESAPELYEKLGLSYEEYAAVGMSGPGGLNTALDYSKDIKTILRETALWNHAHRMQESFGDKMQSAALLVASVFQRVPAISVTVTFLLLLMIALMIMLFLCKNWRLLCALAGGIGLSFAELCYLGFRGRLTTAVLLAEVGVACFYACGILLIVVSNQVDLFKTTRNRIVCVCMLAFLFAGGVSASASWVRHIGNQEFAYQKNAAITNAIRQYCHDRPENIYFEPALSISAHSYALTFQYDNDFNHVMILGGWNYSSPEYKKALEAFGVKGTVEQAILSNNNVYIVSAPYHISNIIQYFSWKYGTQLSFEIIDTVDTVNEIYVYDFNIIQKN